MGAIYSSVIAGTVARRVSTAKRTPEHSTEPRTAESHLGNVIWPRLASRSFCFLAGRVMIHMRVCDNQSVATVVELSLTKSLLQERVRSVHVATPSRRQHCSISDLHSHGSTLIAESSCPAEPALVCAEVCTVCLRLAEGPRNAWWSTCPAGPGKCSVHALQRQHSRTAVENLCRLRHCPNFSHAMAEKIAKILHIVQILPGIS